MGLRLINANELEDLFNFGIDDLAVLGDNRLDDKVLQIIRQQQTINAVPYYEVAKTITKIMETNSNFDYVKRQDVIDMLWRLIDGKEAADVI